MGLGIIAKLLVVMLVYDYIAPISTTASRRRPPTTPLPNPSVPVPFFLRRRAGSVRIPQATEGTTADAPSRAYLNDFLATSDGLDLVKAFMCIEDAKLRAIVLVLLVTGSCRRRSELACR
jgi:hypothetical protein